MNYFDFYENLNEIVYAANADNYEMVYMNRRAREVFSVKSEDDYKGKKCYSFLQDCSSPCHFCTNKSLKEGEFFEWEYFNPSLSKSFLLKDTLIAMPDGTLCRLEIAIELSLRKGTINNRISHEFVINEGLRIAMSSSVPSESIKLLIEYMGKTLDSERAYIFEENESGNFDNTYEWCAPNVEPQKDNLKNIPPEDFQLWMNRFNGRGNVIIRNLEDIKQEDPIMYDYLYPQDITSLVASPISVNGKITGFFGVDNPPDDSFKNISDIFFILGHFIGSLITSRNLFEKLEKLSFSDLLTGVGNRHAMDEYVGSINKSDSIGVLFCDLMGLKKVNDSKGHHAGDAMLIRACDCIKRAFPDTPLFRMGGDEFLVLCPGISEEELHEKTALLKKHMTEEEALMAIGLLWRPDSHDSIDKLLSEADAKMYEDKREYYKNKTN